MQSIAHTEFAAQPTFIAAIADAEIRAGRSYFPQHIVEDDELGHYAIDEGDYPIIPQAIIDRVVHTIPGKLSDEY